MRRKVERYINACPTCNQAKPDCYKPYGELQPITAPDVPFATITLDFIVALPMSSAESDALLTITDKFSKYVKLIPGKMTFTAKEWATRYFAEVFKDWGSPQTVISDRDLKITGDFWQEVFRTVKVRLTLTMAYHSQADYQSE